jgi:outer membrane receptor protein involved in Fe transport
MTQCFSPAFNPTFNPNAPACLQMTRDTNNGAFNAADVSYTNAAAIETSGVDVQFNWGTGLGNGNLLVSFLASYLDSMKSQLSPTSPWIEWKGTFGPTGISGVNGGAYDYRTFTTVSYAKGDWNVALRWRYLPSILPSAAATATTAILATNTYNIFDLSGSVGFGQKWNFRYGIDNLFDKAPEVTDATPWSPGSATNGNFYDVLGRAVFVGMDMKF